MKRIGKGRGIYLLSICYGLSWLVINISAADSGLLKWDSISKSEEVSSSAEELETSFSVTNCHSKSIEIEGIRTSCGCTVAEAPEEPWVLGPGEVGKMKLTVDLKGKRGVLNKLVCVSSSVGRYFLVLKVKIIECEEDDEKRAARQRRVKAALVDRQVVFKGGCRKCHLEPLEEKRGKDLYKAACEICHQPERRATMVPDLREFAGIAPAAYWRELTVKGKEQTLMPAFGSDKGGPLSDEQIDSLVGYLVEDFGSNRDMED